MVRNEPIGKNLFTPESYTIASVLFPKLLGFIFFFAFGAFLFQIKGLIGTNGILPIEKFLDWIKSHYKNKCYAIAPTIFWWNCSDRMLMGVVGLGTFLSVLLMLGIFPPLTLLLLYILYLSIIVGGQDFLSFGWEGFLLEITINAFFLTLTPIPNLMVWVSINLVLFRFHIQAGAVKIQSHDPNWRDLSAVAYHYQSQPIPNTQAWYADKLPLWFQKQSAMFMYVCELIIPFGIFGPDWMRLGVCVALVSLQVFIWMTGNFSYLNHLTAALCTILIANQYLEPWFVAPDITEAQSFWLDSLCTAVGTFLVIMQCIVLWNHFVPNPLFSQWVNKLSRYHIANRYGIFAVMTTTRYEIVFEGSDDGIEWKEYTFYYKPSEIDRRPRRISPYQPRLDWQVWFLPFGNYRYDAWLGEFITCLLKGNREVLALLRGNPFPGTPPRYVRSLMYEYVFSTSEEKKKYGWWWRRKLVSIFTKPMMLNP